jgi:putative phage-type endonuclease
MYNNISDDEFDKKKHEMTKLVEKVMSVFYRYISPRRSYKTTFVFKPASKNRLEKISKKIDFLKSIPQAQQRTKEWYDARSNYLTASNIWKAFGTQSSQNQLIYEKCVKKNMENVNQQNSYVSTESTLHWGQKYEPVSLMWYENEYSAKISDFGCIPHKSISFLAASPDGINTCIKSSRYGRMIEIKNIVNREINGNPKMEYWIQMQIQMEVCGLNECDFIETKFVEYDGEDYYKKTSANDSEEIEDASEAGTSEAGTSEAGTSEAGTNTSEAVAVTSADTDQSVAKGVIIFFIQNEKPLYEYSKINITPDEFEVWEAEMMEKHKDLTWNRNIYWKLEKVSCVLVLRNKLWFKSAYNVLKNIWETIVKERETNEYLNRAPKKRSRASTAIECKDVFVNLFSDEFIAEIQKEEEEKGNNI